MNKEYHNLIKEAFLKDWDSYIIKEDYRNSNFSDILYVSRDYFLNFYKKNKINYSTIAGTIQEWVIFNFLKTGLVVSRKIIYHV